MLDEQASVFEDEDNLAVGKLWVYIPKAGFLLLWPLLFHMFAQHCDKGKIQVNHYFVNY